MTRVLQPRALAWAVATACAVAAIGWLVAAPLSPASQAVFGLALAAVGVASARLRSRHSLLLVCIVTFIASTRYLVWRLEGAGGLSSPAEWLWGGGLLVTEVYTWVVMVLSFIQQARPLRRPIALLNHVAESTPTVDVYVPSYNEPLSVVGPTVIAALAMDYPAGRFRVFLLDDGDRPEFAEFARRVGCEYLARDENTHAKAGNLNAAMKVTDGELICVLDCDHVPTRAFLQLTVGWFEKDPKLAIVQTPHFFYSPDPVQRNVAGAESMPGEGDLFYDTIQSGNDLWNATFFCGSCAVIRRAALEEVGGFAYETVTEDAHTALRIQRRGWNTAFLNIRLSAGLATETLGQHIAQRARWCRGMTQILRIDNPLFGPGLGFFQRLCYLNALLYYQFPLVRIAFLTSPLAYLFFGLNIIHAPAGEVLVYAAPHLLLGLSANHRLQGKQRRLFWGEIFETILAFHLVRTAVLSFVWPKAGKFKVTDKGLRLETGFFDVDLVRPHLITAGLLGLGLVAGAARVLWAGASLATLALNAAWTCFNVLILLSAVAVAREQRQVRAHVRRDACMPVTVYFADGRLIDAMTANVSTGGLAITLTPDADTGGREVTHIDLQVAGGRAAFPVRQVPAPDGELRVQFVEVDDARERRLIQALMARADSWQPAAAAKDDWASSLLPLFRIASTTLRFVGVTGLQQARTKLRRAAPAACAVGAVLALAHPGGPARAAPAADLTQKAIRLADLSRPSSGAAAGDCARRTARLVLPADAVVLAARLQPAPGAAAPDATLIVNGQAAGPRLAAADVPLEPAVFLPGVNEIRVAAAPGSRCQAARLLATASLVLTTAPLTPPTPAAPTSPPPAPHATAAAAHAAHPATAPAAAAAQMARRGAARPVPLSENPLALALLAVAASAVLSRALGRLLDAQAARRLHGLKEVVA